MSRQTPRNGCRLGYSLHRALVLLSMVALSSEPASAHRPTAFAEGIKLHVTRWLLLRKLSRRTTAEFAGVAFKVIAIRLYSATACFLSMLLMAWIGSFIRAVSADDWNAFRASDGATLLAVSAQAASHQRYLVPILLWWAVLLLLTPTGYTLAFRAAAVAAGILGYLQLFPPPVVLSARVAGISHWLMRFDNHWNRYAIAVLIFSMVLAYVLQSSAVAIFRHLTYLSNKPGRVPYGALRSPGFIQRLCVALLVLLVLLSAGWAAIIARLSASGVNGASSEESYGFQGGLLLGNYLLVLILIAVLISHATAGDKWLTGAAVVTVLYALVPHTPALPPYLETSVAREQLTRIGMAWGADALWAALFIFVPVAVLGIHLVARLLRSP